MMGRKKVKGAELQTRRFSAAHDYAYSDRAGGYDGLSADFYAGLQFHGL